MNATASVVLAPQGPTMEQAFRRALTDPGTRQETRNRIGWDDSQVSRFLSGQMGLPIDKIDAAIAALSMVVTTPGYMDFLAYGARIGANCHCARAGMGECSPRR